MKVGDLGIAAIDLFCGVGGLTHGLQRVGLDVRLGVDIDPACKFPYERNNRARFMAADIADVTAEMLKAELSGGAVTLLAGCAPCQPFSTYARSAKGARKGDRLGRGKVDDWKLVRRFAELIEDVQPDLVTMENVPPLAHMDVFRDFIARLDGYEIDYKVVECRSVGLPQTRKRLVLVASRLGPIKLPEFNVPISTVRQTIAGLPPLAAGEMNDDDPLHCASRLSQLNLRRIRASQPGGTWRDWPEELRATCHTKKTGETYPSVYGRMVWDAPAPTITTQCFGYGNGRFGHPAQDRAISLREAAMLQGFPKDYAFVEEGGKVSFASLGRMIGNAVPVMLSEAIGRTLQDHVIEVRR